MPEAIIRCARCGNKIYHEFAHPFEDTNGKLTEMLCGLCCPNCWGGADNGPKRPQHGDTQFESPERQAQGLPLEAQQSSDN